MAQKSAKPCRSAAVRSAGPILRTIGHSGVWLAPAITWKVAMAVPPWKARVQAVAALRAAVQGSGSREAATDLSGVYAPSYGMSCGWRGAAWASYVTGPGPEGAHV